MKELLDKITSYNIFNNLLPGVLFVLIAKSTTSYNFVQEDNLLGAFLYYFIGMTISRVGSVIVEPFLKRVSFLKFADYKRYVHASKLDSKIDLHSEVNNTYRTLSTMMLLLLILKGYNVLSDRYGFSNSIPLVLLTLLVFALFMFSYRKQTNFIVKRVDANAPSDIT